MEIKTAMAGTLESGDIFIQIAPNDNAGLHIDLDSTVAYQFGDQIKKVITETLQGLGIDQAEVKATDKRHGQRRVGRLINLNSSLNTTKLLCNDSEEQ